MIHHGGTRIYTEKILARITKTRRHESKYLLVEVFGSLKGSRGAGRPDGHIGTNGKAPVDESKLASLRPPGLPIQPLSDPSTSTNIFFSEPSEDSSEPAE